MRFIYKQVLRFKYAFRGIKIGLQHDTSFKTQFFLGGLFVACFWYLMRPLSDVEAIFLLFAWILVLITELQNSAFEEALDHLHPDTHHRIGKSKDVAAGAVLIAGIFALIVFIWITARHV